MYKYLYGQIVYGGGLAPKGCTVVFPVEIRTVVRERFANIKSGEYDDEHMHGHVVSLDEMLTFKWRMPPKSCHACNL